MTLLSSLNQGANFTPTATTSVSGIDPLATLAQVQAATDSQRQITSYKLGLSYVGYYVAGRAYSQGQVAFYNGTAWQVISISPTTQTPGPIGATDWAPAELTLPALPANASITPPVIFGAGTSALPYIVGQLTHTPGSTGNVLAQINVSNMTPGAYVSIADLNAAANGYRFVSDNHYVNGAGVLSFNVIFNDTPTSAYGTAYTCKLRVGNGSVYVQLGSLLGAVSLFSPSSMLIPDTVFMSMDAMLSESGMVVEGPPQVVDTPVITNPIDGSVDQPVNFVVAATAFSKGSGDPEDHLSSDWQISADFSFNDVIIETTNDPINLLSWQPLQPVLLAAATLYARVRYRGSLGTQSEWSQAIEFVTTEFAEIDTPAIVTPAYGSTGVDIAITFSASPFTLSSGTDTHVSSDWQLATDPLFNNVVHQTLNSAAAKTSWSPASVLVSSSAYYVRVRYWGSSGVASDYSDVSLFTTALPVGF